MHMILLSMRVGVERCVLAWVACQKPGYLHAHAPNVLASVRLPARPASQYRPFHQYACAIIVSYRHAQKQFQGRHIGG